MTTDHASPWPAGASEMARRIRTHDWAATALGPIEHWPASLRHAVDIALEAGLPMAIAWGAELVLLYNDAHLVSLSHRHPAALGKPLREVWPEAWSNIEPELRRVVDSGESVVFRDRPFKLQADHKRQARYFTGCFSPIRDESGRVGGVLYPALETTSGVLADQENARLLAQQRDAARRVAQLFEQAPGFMAELRGPEHRITSCNEAYRAITGHRDLVGLTVRDAIPGADEQGYVALLDRVYRTGESFVARGALFEAARPRKGHPAQVYIDFVLKPIRDDGGRVDGIFVQGYDVTGHHRAMQALHESEQRYRLLVESAKDYAIVGMDAAGRITSWNVGAERIMGFAESEALGQPVGIFFTPEDRAARAPEQELDEARHKGRAEDERWHQRKDGSRFWGSGLVVPQADDPRRGFMKIFRDRTAEQIAERERESLMAALREADARKDQFLAMLAHELRNPMAPIRTAVSILERDQLAPEQRRATLQMMRRQCMQLGRLVDDLLEVSRITQGKIHLRPEPITVGSAVRSAVETVQPAIDAKRQRLEVSVRASSTIHADPLRLAQVVTNLLTNASKFTPEAGRIELVAEDDGDQVVIGVRDTGIGISADMLARVFDLFSQADRSLAHSQGGLGIGLALVRRLVELHGGSVQVHSAGEGRGATFTVRLPHGGPPGKER